MRSYGAGTTRSGINTADTAYFNLTNAATAAGLWVMQIVIIQAVNPTTAPVFYLTKTTARGTQASTAAGQPIFSGSQASTGTLDVCGTGGSQPTFTAGNKIDMAALPLTVGSAWVFNFFDDPLEVPATSANGIAIANAVASGVTTGTFYCGCRWRE